MEKIWLIEVGEILLGVIFCFNNIVLLVFFVVKISNCMIFT
jgi:hypothetical protein